MSFHVSVCNEWQNIDSLLRNAPAASQQSHLIFAEFAKSRPNRNVRQQVTNQIHITGMLPKQIIIGSEVQSQLAI